MGKGVEKRFGRRAGIPSPRRNRIFQLRRSLPFYERSGGMSRSGDASVAGATDRLAGLDLLRLLAALAVVLFHFGYAGAARGNMSTSFPSIAGIAKYGFIGVELFFLISGFVIASSVFNRSWQQFAAARVLRLYPAFLACMCTTAVVMIVFRTGEVTLVQWLANLTMLSPMFGQPFMDGAYWSIVIEIIFYAWVALFAALGVLQRRLLLILSVWLLIAYFNEIYFQLRPVRLLFCTEFASFFASGILIQRIMAGARSDYVWALLGFAIALGGLHALENQRVIMRLYADTVELPTLLVIHVAIYALFVGAIWASRWIVTTPRVLLLGGITYPLYLVHQHVGYTLLDFLSPMVGSWLALLVVTGALIAFSYAVYLHAEPAGRAALKPWVERGIKLLQRSIGSVGRLPR